MAGFRTREARFSFEARPTEVNAIQKIKGFADLFPPESDKFTFLEKKIGRAHV